MKKTSILLSAALLSVLVVSSAFAQGGMHQTGTRLQAMGLANFQTLDEFNIWINPAFITMHKNRVMVSLGTEDTWNDGYYGAGGVTSKHEDGWGGVNFNTTVGTWGLYYGRPYDGLYRDGSFENLVDDLPSLGGYNRYGAAFGGYFHDAGAFVLNGVPWPHAPDSNIDLFYGKDLGQALLGFRLNYNPYRNAAIPNPAVSGSAQTSTSSSYYTDVIADYGTKQSSSEVNLVAGVFLKGPRIGVSALVGFPSFKNSAVLRDSMTFTDPRPAPDGETVFESADLTEKMQSDGAVNLGLYADKLLKVSEKSTLFITGFFQHMNNSVEKENTVARRSTRTPTDGSAALSYAYDFSQTAKGSDKRSVFGLDAALNHNAGPSTLLIGTLGITHVSADEHLTDSITGDVFTDADGSEQFNPIRWFRAFNNNYLSSGYGAYGVLRDWRWKMTQWDLPLAVAVEHKVAKWLTTRLGVKKSLFQRTETKWTQTNTYEKQPTPNDGTVPYTYETDYTVTYKNILSDDLPATVSTGFTLNITDSFALTGVLNYDVLFSGTYLVSGNRTYDALNTAVELTYTF